MLCRERSPRTSTGERPLLTSNKEPAQPKRDTDRLEYGFGGRGWLHWVCTDAHRLFLVAASGGYSSFWCTGFSLQRLLLFQSTGWRHTDSGAAVCSSRMCRHQQLWHTGLVAHIACGIFPDQGSNPCPLHLQAVSYPPYHIPGKSWDVF